MLARLVLASMLLAVTGLCTADDKKDEKKKDDKDLIQGEWVVVDSTIQQQIGKKIVVKGDEWTSSRGTKVHDHDRREQETEATRLGLGRRK